MKPTMNFQSNGYPVKCKCNEYSKWFLITDSDEEIYLCERCYTKYCENVLKEINKNG